jgi:uncharacterized protein YwqG
MTDRLPASLQPYRDAIEATRRPVIDMYPIDAPADLKASRLGGAPWWPAHRPWPVDNKGAPLFLLLQINFRETPALSPFPQEGILQLFIGDDCVYGCNFNDIHKPPGFACVYHRDLSSPARDDFGFLERAEGYTLPLDAPLNPIGLGFSLSSMTMDSSDYRFPGALPDIADNEELLEAYFNWASEARSAWRLGGYPTFTQSDPRENTEFAGLGFTLATIDSSDGVMWGDMGAGQFLINEKDLAAGDFSRVGEGYRQGGTVLRPRGRIGLTAPGTPIFPP